MPTMGLAELGFSYPDRSNIALIQELRGQYLIKDGSPFWWSTDYAPDPRELLPFKEFRQRLVGLGTCPTERLFRQGNDVIQREVYLYPEPSVPMPLLGVDIEGQQLQFLVT